MNQSCALWEFCRTMQVFVKKERCCRGWNADRHTGGAGADGQSCRDVKNEMIGSETSWVRET